MKWYERIYALYKGDVNICDGTIPEIAEYTGKTVQAIRYMTFPAYHKRGGDKAVHRNRYELVLIEDDEQELKRNA